MLVTQRWMRLESRASWSRRTLYSVTSADCHTEPEGSATNRSVAIPGFVFFLNVFLLLFWRKVLLLHYSFLWAQWYTSGDVCSMFQSQCGTIACVLHHLHAMWSPDSPLARHLLGSWWPAAKPFLIHRTTHHSISIANNKFCFVS